jgi:hypothetical protein
MLVCECLFTAPFARGTPVKWSANLTGQAEDAENNYFSIAVDPG